MLGDGRAFDAQRGRPEPPGPDLAKSVQTPFLLPSFPSQPSKSKSSGLKPAPKPAPLLPSNFGAAFEHVFKCHLEGRKLHVEVRPSVRATPDAIDRLIDASADVACEAVVVSVPKSADFADWMRRLLYTGFTVVSKRDSWDVPASPGSVACVLDLSDRSSASATSDDSSVLTDDDSDDDDSDDDSWLDDDD